MVACRAGLLGLNLVLGMGVCNFLSKSGNAEENSCNVMWGMLLGGSQADVCIPAGLK